MSYLTQHVICRLADDRVVAPSPDKRLIVARAVLKVGRRFNLVGFSLVDTHLHMLPVSRQAPELARRVEISLQKALRPGVPFFRARCVDIADQWHLQSALVYQFRQQLKHKVPLDVFHEGSNLPDLLGLRLIGAYTAENVRRFVPRLAADGLRRALAAGEPERAVVLPRFTQACGPIDLVAEAAAAAIGQPTLGGKSPLARAARHAAVEIIGRRLSLRQVAALLGVGRSTIARLRRAPADPRMACAVRLQLGLRQASLRGALRGGIAANPPAAQ